MKSEIVVPVVASLIAALASIGGILFSQNSTMQIENQKWQQARLGEREKIDNAALAAFAEEFATAFDRTSYFLWRVEMMAPTLKTQDFETYTAETKAQKPKLVAAQVLLATNNRAKYDRILPLIDEYRRVDEQISTSGLRFQEHRNEVLKLLDTEVKKLNFFERQMIDLLSQAKKSG